MSANSAPIVCNGQTFPSVKAFALFYGINYSKAQYYRKKGKTPEEILDACQFAAARTSCDMPKESVKRYHCEYDGVTYSSLYEAATALGFAPAQLYELRKRNNLSPSEAIALAVERRAQKGKGSPRVAKPCVVEGVEYESREAAILAYKVPRITVYSRMEREGLSFEEALVQGRKAVLYRPPTVSLFPSLRLCPTTNELKQSTLRELAASLSYYNCSVQPMQDLITHAQALLLDGSNYIYFNLDAHGVEYISELPFCLDADTLNLLNGAYVATKLFVDPQSNRLFLFSFQMAKEESQSIKPLLNAYFAFVSIKDTLVRGFSSDTPVAVGKE